MIWVLRVAVLGLYLLSQTAFAKTLSLPENLGERALYDVIVGQTKTAFGRSVNPHLFRDCAATSVAIDDPAHVRVASQLLGHRSTSTTERYYNQAQAIDAARRYQDFLIALRNGTIAEDIDSV